MLNLEFRGAFSSILRQIFMMCPMYPFLDFCSPFPARIFKSSSASYTIKFSRISFKNRDSWRGESGYSLMAIFMIFIISLWRILFIEYCLNRLNKTGKNSVFSAIISRHSRTFYLTIKDKISTIFTLPNPRAFLRSCNFANDFSTKSFINYFNSVTNSSFITRLALFKKHIKTGVL